MAGDQKLPGDRNEQGSRDGLAHHHIALIVGAIVVLIIAGGVFLNEAAKNPQSSTEKLPVDRDVLYQVSTINALVLGVYDGVQSAGDIQKHGDFGIGTFEALDGEMIVVDGKYYQATSDGSVHIVDPSIMVPFATVTFFDNDKSIPLSGGGNLTTFTNRIDKALPSKNLIYAIRVDGTFPEVVVRAIPAQKKPYPPLAEAATHQVVTNLKNTTGTIVGFYLTPLYEWRQYARIPPPLYFFRQEKRRTYPGFNGTGDPGYRDDRSDRRLFHVCPDNRSFRGNEPFQGRFTGSSAGRKQVRIIGREYYRYDR